MAKRRNLKKEKQERNRAMQESSRKENYVGMYDQMVLATLLEV